MRRRLRGEGRLDDGIRPRRLPADQLGDLRGTGPDFIPGAGFSFGLGLAVRVELGGTSLGFVGDC